MVRRPKGERDRHHIGGIFVDLPETERCLGITAAGDYYVERALMVRHGVCYLESVGI